MSNMSKHILAQEEKGLHLLPDRDNQCDPDYEETGSMSEFRVEENVPLPKRAPQSQYPLDEMNEGDSFLGYRAPKGVSGREETELLRRAQRRLSTAARRHFLRHGDKKFSVLMVAEKDRKTGEEYRGMRVYCLPAESRPEPAKKAAPVKKEANAKAKQDDARQEPWYLNQDEQGNSDEDNEPA